MDPKRSPRAGSSPSAFPKSVPGSGRAGGAPATPVPASRRPVPGLGEALDLLARDIRLLQIEYEKFFNGALPMPPEDFRHRVQTQLRNLRNATTTSAVDNFRLADLEARFNSYNELFNRRVREREEGRHRAHRPAPVEVRRFDPRQGIVVGETVDPEAAEALYQGLASGPGDGPRFDLDSFQTYLARQAAAIRAKTGCAEVQFRLADEEGKLKLKARPLSHEGS